MKRGVIASLDASFLSLLVAVPSPPKQRKGWLSFVHISASEYMLAHSLLQYLREEQIGEGSVKAMLARHTP